MLRFGAKAWPGYTLAIGIALGLQACGGGGNHQGLPPLELEAPKEVVDYEVSLTGSPTQSFTELLQKALRLYTLADRPPPSLPRLERRARGDMEIIVKALRSEGYYEGTARYEILPPVPRADDDQKAADYTEFETHPAAASPETAQSEPARQRVLIFLEPGKQFDLFRFELQVAKSNASSPPVLPDAAELAVPLDQPAVAREIVAAEQRAVDWLRNHGYPYAEHQSRRAIADLDKHRLDVETRFDIGPRATFGPLTIEGLNSVDEHYVRSYLDTDDKIHPEASFDNPTLFGLYAQDRLDKLQRDLSGTGLFERVRVEPVKREALPAQDTPSDVTASTTDPAAAVGQTTLAVPIEVTVNESPARSVGAGLRYSTDVGPALRTFFEHRNLFGANETTRVTATAALDEQELGVTFRKPQFLRNRQALVGSFSLHRLKDAAYGEQAARLGIGLERLVTNKLRLGVGTSFEYARIEDEGRIDTALLFGLPLSARYDGSNSLLDPTKGYRAGATITPYTGRYVEKLVNFVIIDTDLATYWPLDSKARYVFAARTRVASAVGAQRDDIPPPQRLYSGGGGSVRGYKPRFIGPLDADGDPIGGRSVIEVGTEMRIKITPNIGVVPFLGLGTVSEFVLPDLQSGIQFGAGLGVRYHTTVGPIRADIAVPLNKRKEDDSYQFYVSIGQAF